MLRPHFHAVSLRYGCHEGEWHFPDEARPVVIAGPNGSGKSSLVEGLVRTLFGFDRRRGDDASERESRQPWAQEGMRGRVLLRGNGERVEIQRDFTTDRVRVHDPDDGVEHFVGDGNAGARNQEARHYRQILTDLLGLRDMDGYRRTLLIRQGDLLTTALGDHLLRIAAGGHARVETARWQIAQAHRAITRRSLHAGAAPAINPREMEKLEEEIAEVRARLEDARAASDRRAPLALDRDQIGERIAALDEQIDILEHAVSALARTGVTELNARHLRQQAQRFEGAAGSLREAEDELQEAQAALRDALSVGRYPDDFSERVAGAELRWRDLEELRRPPAPWLGVAALLLLAAAAVLLLMGYPVPAGITAGAGGLAGAAWGTLWLWGRRRGKAARREVETLLEGVPHAESLRPRTKARAMEYFQAQQSAFSRVAEARRELADALREGRSALIEWEEGSGSGRPARLARPVDGVDGAETRAQAVLARLHAAANTTRERLAVGRSELERIGDLSLALPNDVPPTEQAVATALRERRAERSRLQEKLRQVSQELLDRGTPAESVEALEGHLATLEPRLTALGRKAEVLEAAHALILDAYDEFRDRDQDRLAERVSRHVATLGGDRLEGIHVDGSLDEARVRTDGRLVPMSTPPLSFGEFHALQLGVRLGAADFLAGMGIHPPLIIDEPFAHLDADRAAAVWRLLAEVAATRQVIITTQNTRLLEELGVRPDISLG